MRKSSKLSLVPLVPRNTTEIVELLSELLDKAKSGQIVDVAVLAQSKDNDLDWFWAGATNSVYDQFGKLEYIKLRLFEEYFKKHSNE